MPQNNKKLAQLVGRWETEGQDSAAVFEIVVNRSQPIVSGFDQTDGERFKISQVNWNGKSLSFSAYMPSSRWRTWHRFTSIGRGVVAHELTLTERWIRVVSPSRGEVTPTTLVRPKTKKQKAAKKR